MEAELLSLSGLVLMFVLGLRHGLDPDHIACIDGLTWRALNHQHEHAAWIGTLFAIGHGLLVTAIAMGVSQLTRSINVPDPVVLVFGWVPTALLLLVGTLNLRLMLSPDPLMGKNGYPLLLASGETADGRRHLLDRQHPHELVMEMSASYSHRLSDTDSAFLYIGYPGEPLQPRPPATLDGRLVRR